MARTQLKPYQRDTVRRAEAFAGRAIFGHDPGLGKTICTLSLLARNKHMLPAVVVCPAAVKYVWEHEAITHAGRRVVVCEHREPPARGIGGAADIYVINYDILKYWVPWLRACDPQTVVYDECQNLSNRSTGRTKAARRLATQVPHAIALSGTPLMNRPAELWPTLNIVRPDLYPSFWEFAHRFCGPKRERWGWTYKGAERLDELHGELNENLLIRYRKADVLKDLPAKVREVLPLALPAKAMAEYKRATSDFLTWLRQQDPAKYESARKAQAMTQMGYLLRLVARLKLRTVVDWANSFLADTDEKLVLFAYHTKMIEALSRRCNAKSVTIDGSVTGRPRAAAVDQFQRDPATRLSINQLQAGGVGINGYTVARTCAFTEMWWRPGDFIQAADRLHRIGQDETVWENWLVAHGTIEEKLCRVLQEKQAILSDVLDGGTTAQDLAVFDRLMELVKDEGL